MGDPSKWTLVEYRGGRGRPLRTLRVRSASITSFWGRVATEGDGCWLFGGHVDEATGYGRVKIGSKHLLAHRWAFTLKRGPVPDGLDLDHLCRNKLCVNPAHLEPVTNLENCRRGLQVESIRGEANTHAKLTEVDVAQIRDLCRASPMKQREIALAFGVCQATITHINVGRNWRHSDG